MRTLDRVLLATSIALAAGYPAAAQTTFRRAGTEFNAVRPVMVATGKGYTVAVTQFFHHGEITADGKNVLVFGKRDPAPTRVLQVGPGDYCRLAFELAAGQASYEILYGGQPPAAGAAPAWSNGDGLLLETREFAQCNLNSFESVRDAFNSAKPIGADYVDAVHHSHNPFTLAMAPFMSRYSGTLHIEAGAKYGFMTASQDASFLLVDGKVVVEAPGVHGPAGQARTGSRKDVQLAAGPHKFDYYHAASGPASRTSAAWEINPTQEKPQKAESIPPQLFRAASLAHVDAGPVSTRAEKLVPDFLLKIAGSVPLPDNEVPLVGVQFFNASPRALMTNTKCVWDFGDGQTSEEENPTHVFLRPGLYTIKLIVRRANKPFEMAHRIHIDQPKVTGQDKLHKLEDYLPLLRTYNATQLDAASLGQLVQAFQAKADALVAPPEQPALPPGQQEEVTPEKAAKQQEVSAANKAESLKYLAVAVAAGRAALVEESALKGDEDILKLVRLVGPMARDQLGDSLTAGQVWSAAAKRVASAAGKAECLVQAADIAVNDMINATAAKSYLDSAAGHASGPKSGPLSAQLARVQGDYFALSGDGKAARKAYLEAEAMHKTRQTNVESIAWQGAHERSTEQFLKSGELDRAAAEIRQWQAEFPTDKVSGNATLAYARYWAARKMYPQAIAMAGQLSAVNADSPYVDQIQMLAVDCDLAQGQRDKAIARLESFLKGYPGSPLAPLAKERLGQLKSGDAKKPAAKKKG